MASEERIQRREDRLLARYRSIRGTYVGSLFLCIITGIGTILALRYHSNGEQLASAGGPMFIVWMGIASVMDAKLKHVRTIRRYRAMLDSDADRT